MDITGAQVVGAAFFTFALAAMAVYLLVVPALTDPNFSAANFAQLSVEPWFLLVGIIIQDSILSAVAIDQALFRGRLKRSEMGLRLVRTPHSLPRQVAFGVAAGAGTFAISALALQLVINALRSGGIDPGSGVGGLQPRIASLSDYGFWVVSGVIVAPVAEELFFRGYALGGFEKRGFANRGLIATSVLFAAVHLDAFSFGPLLAAGLVLGSLRLSTGSLVAPIVGHATNNFIVMTLTLFGF